MCRGLQTQPGIIVAEQKVEGGRFYVSGLRDHTCGESAHHPVGSVPGAVVYQNHFLHQPSRSGGGPLQVRQRLDFGENASSVRSPW